MNRNRLNRSKNINSDLIEILKQKELTDRKIIKTFTDNLDKIKDTIDKVDYISACLPILSMALFWKGLELFTH